MRRDDGSMSLEMVLVTPLFVIFLLFLAGVGRMVDAQSQVDGAARDAARAASLARSERDAVDMAEKAGDASLKGRNWCTGGPQVKADTYNWRPGGTVKVKVFCDVDLSDMSFIGLPGTKELTGDALAPIDFYTYRGTETADEP
ncbi:TadE family protein [Actinomadura macrotermitis]|uniref:TadE-like domain-containing protein n=1 Tax=Actinomadura macrotermitis TaxID=2585200 RepID=A0A7K0C2J5_9ACTN|nr:TadE family protein [Actinomadura macrotermitis]MQY07342.1 hypothetical protein [Actinomadura macrotermitis]